MRTAERILSLSGKSNSGKTEVQLGVWFFFVCGVSIDLCRWPFWFSLRQWFWQAGDPLLQEPHPAWAVYVLLHPVPYRHHSEEETQPALGGPRGPRYTRSSCCLAFTAHCNHYTHIYYTSYHTVWDIASLINITHSYFHTHLFTDLLYFMLLQNYFHTNVFTDLLYIAVLESTRKRFQLNQYSSKPVRLVLICL